MEAAIYASRPESLSFAQGIWATGGVRSATLLILAIYWKRRGWTFSGLGLTGQKAKKGIYIGIAGCAAFGVAVAVGETVLRLLGESLLQAMKSSPPTPAEFAALAAVGGLVAPLCEEAVFRGLLYKGLRKRFSPVAAMAATTLLFASAHVVSSPLPWSEISGRFLAGQKLGALIQIIVGLPWIQVAGGLAFCLAFELSQSLWAPVIIHSVGNLVIFSLPFVPFL